MRLLLLAALLPFHQDPADQPTWRRQLIMMNSSTDLIRAGDQISMKRPSYRGEIEVRHKGKSLATWTHGDEIWFRAAADIKDYERDVDYEIRYGDISVQSRPEEVFEFFDEPGKKAPDPKKWQVDPHFRIQPDAAGFAVTDLPPGRSESDPASLILRHAPGDDFILEVELSWELREKAAISFAMRVEMEDETKIPEETRKQCDALIVSLGSDDLETRERAYGTLVKLGPLAVPQLKNAASRSTHWETRVRARSAIAEIEEKDPPREINAGWTIDREDPKSLVHRAQLGKSRQKLLGSLKRADKATVTIQRSKSGWTSLGWWRSVDRSSNVPGKAKSIRFDFWGDTPGEFGAVWFTRVIVRRNAGRATSSLGPQEEVK